MKKYRLIPEWIYKFAHATLSFKWLVYLFVKLYRPRWNNHTIRAWHESVFWGQI